MPGKLHIAVCILQVCLLFCGGWGWPGVSFTFRYDFLENCNFLGITYIQNGFPDFCSFLGITHIITDVLQERLSDAVRTEQM